MFHADGRTDRHHEANSRFPQFCERVQILSSLYTLSRHMHTRRAQGLLHLGIVPPLANSNKGRCTKEDLPSLAAASLSSVVNKLPLVVHSERFLLQTIAWFFFLSSHLPRLTSIHSSKYTSRHKHNNCLTPLRRATRFLCNQEKEACEFTRIGTNVGVDRAQGRGNWRRLHTEELHDLYFSSLISSGK